MPNFIIFFFLPRRRLRANLWIVFHLSRIFEIDIIYGLTNNDQKLGVCNSLTILLALVSQQSWPFRAITVISITTQPSKLFAGLLARHCL